MNTEKGFTFNQIAVLINDTEIESFIDYEVEELIFDTLNYMLDSCPVFDWSEEDSEGTLNAAFTNVKAILEKDFEFTTVREVAIIIANYLDNHYYTELLDYNENGAVITDKWWDEF